MPADPQLVEATGRLSSTFLRVLIPGIVIIGVICGLFVYFHAKIKKKITDLTKRKKPTIFMFEDDKFLLGCYVQKLTDRGFEVTGFEYPPDDVVDKVARKMPDLVSTGMIMPKMTGFDLLKKLKDDQRTKGIPVVVLTNLGQKEDFEKAMGLGAAEYLIKANCTPEDVVNTFRKILSFPKILNSK